MKREKTVPQLLFTHFSYLLLAFPNWGTLTTLYNQPKKPKLRTNLVNLSYYHRHNHTRARTHTMTYIDILLSCEENTKI
jgi:hypothetical protein